MIRSMSWLNIIIRMESIRKGKHNFPLELAAVVSISHSFAGRLLIRI